MSRKLELEIKKVSDKFAKDAAYRGSLADRQTMSYDEVIAEVINKSMMRLSEMQLKSIVASVLDTMIEGVLTDGISRRLGDYFTLQLEVRGRFDSPGEQFDEDKHQLALVMRPHKAMRQKPGRDGVSVYNYNAGPAVKITRMYSEGVESGSVVKFGSDIVIEGENLTALSDYKDEFHVKYFTQRKHAAYVLSSQLEPEWVNAAGTKMVIPWKEAFADFFENNPDYVPEKTASIALMITLLTRGGEATAKQQLHRARAYFDTWVAKYPEYFDDFDRLRWGHY